MRSIIAALMLTSVPAVAQLLSLPPTLGEMPVTIKLYDNATKAPIGTATTSGNRIYYRDNDGKHTATVVIYPDKTMTFYDPDGRAIAK